MLIAYLALAGRIILVGFERIFVKNLSKYDSAVVSFWWFFLALLLYLPFAVYVWQTQGIPDFSFVPYTMIVTLIYGVAFVSYAYALKISDVSLVAPLYNFNVLFLLVLAVLILGESFTLFKLAGIALLLFGAYFLNNEKNFFKSYRELLRDRGVLYMMLCTCLIAVGRIFDGFFMQSVPPVVYGVFLEFFISVYLILFIAYRHRLPEIRKMVSERPGMTFLMGFANGFSYLFLLIAFTKMEVSVAEPLTMLGALISIVLAKIFFKEKIKGRLLGGVVMVIGAWLLFV